MSRILIVLFGIAGTVHIVFFAGPQMAGVSPLFMLVLGAAGAAVAIVAERRDHQRRQRKAELRRRCAASSCAGGAPLSEPEEGRRARVA